MYQKIKIKNATFLLILCITSLISVGFSGWVFVNENKNSLSLNVDSEVGDVLDLRGIATLNGTIDISNYSASGFIVNDAISSNGYVTCPITFSPIEGFTNYTLYSELTPSNSNIVSFIIRCAYSLDAKFDVTDSFMNRISDKRGAFSYTSSSLSTSFYVIFEIGEFDENLLSYRKIKREFIEDRYFIIYFSLCSFLLHLLQYVHGYYLM